MRWVMALLFVGGASYLGWRGTRKPPAPPPAPPVAAASPAPVLGATEMRRVRDSLSDPDPAIRWAAVELLFAVRDPEMLARLEEMAAKDVEPELRRKALGLLQQGGSSALMGLIAGLRDPEPEVRLASLKSIGEIGDPSASPWVTETAVSDIEPEVKAAALRTLGRFQERRVSEFRALAEKLRKDYEKELERRKRQLEGTDR